MKSWPTVVVAALATGILASAVQAEVFVYPKPGQSQDAFQKDQYECHNWAKQQTGFDPAKPPQAAAAPPPQQGGAVKGAARGAAVGAVGGAVAGDAGKGAAVGAAAGGTAGVMRQNSNNRAAAQASQQAQAQQQASYGNYERAYSACLGGRGYTVK
jgi:YMGG-like Gly-zipper